MFHGSALAASTSTAGEVRVWLKTRIEDLTVGDHDIILDAGWLDMAELLVLASLAGSSAPQAQHASDACSPMHGAMPPIWPALKRDSAPARGNATPG